MTWIKNVQPDLTAPGINILAAWSPIAPASVYKGDTRSTKYYIDSGTSMACPHASGAAAYVKATHPTWSPAAIKSALMTTGEDRNKNPLSHSECSTLYSINCNLSHVLLYIYIYI
jgi:subtilisin family serine protease